MERRPPTLVEAVPSPAAWTPELLAGVRADALAAGFDLAGVASCPAAEESDGTLSAERFSAWIESGRAGEMHFLKRANEAGELLRRSARTALPWARSILVCALNYNAAGPCSIDPSPASTGWIARYAWSGSPAGAPVDYHDDLMIRLRAIEADLHARGPYQQPVLTRCYVDTGPLLERDFAARAGIGWVGKNTCVLNQQLGSWLLLGVIVTSLPMQLRVALAPDRCGTCTRCIDACPTAALLPETSARGRQMDASRCIAYLTIEKKGSIPEDLRAGMGRQVFGCDICQEVCPWNGRAPAAHQAELTVRPELINPELSWLAQLDRDSFRRNFAGSPLERTRLPRLQRNVAIAMGNSGDASFRPQLERWAAADPLEPGNRADPALAEAAQWALAQLTKAAAASASIVPSVERQHAGMGAPNGVVEQDPGENPAEDPGENPAEDPATEHDAEWSD